MPHGNAKFTPADAKPTLPGVDDLFMVEQLGINEAMRWPGSRNCGVGHTPKRGRQKFR
jgi:hypothetical protein